MKVAQICTNVMSGSVGSIVRNLCDELKKDKHEYLICYGRGNAPLGYNYYKFDNKLDIYSHVIFARLFDSDGLHSKRATLRLIKKLKAFKPDVVHIHCLHGYYINYPILFKYLKEYEIKVVWTMHDCWAFTGHCCYFDMVKCKKWESLCNKCIQKNNYPKAIIFDRCRRNYKKKKHIFKLLECDKLIIISPSEWLKNLLEQSFLNKYNCITINNGIDTGVFKKLKIKKDKTVLGVASIWDARKGLDDFIQLSKELPQQYNIKIIGTTDKQIQFLKKYNIEAIKKTNSVEELVKEYNKALVLFNPTYEDNYPTVNLESLACGTPVITYDTGGSGEIIKETGNGIIINKNNYHSLIQYLDFVHELDYYNTLAEQKNILSKELMCSKYIKLYKK